VRETGQPHQRLRHRRAARHHQASDAEPGSREQLAASDEMVGDTDHGFLPV